MFSSEENLNHKFGHDFRVALKPLSGRAQKLILDRKRPSEIFSNSGKSKKHTVSVKYLSTTEIVYKATLESRIQGLHGILPHILLSVKTYILLCR